MNRGVLPGHVSLLVRPVLSFSVAISSFAGYALNRNCLEWRAVFAAAGIFLLACGASALNQLQEIRLDARMERTKARPLPMRTMPPAAALFAAFIFVSAGAAVLFVTTTFFAGVLSLATVVWYNGVYTPLKPKTRYAVLIGAVTGALPPLIGYAAAGGRADVRCIPLCLFMFLWQIAHFQLLLVKYGADYEKTGFPALVPAGKERRLRMSVFAGVVAAAASALVFPVFGIIKGIGCTGWVIVTCALVVSYFYSALRGEKGTFNFKIASIALFLFQASMLAAVVAGSMWDFR
jgi:protoheme IX farnesyltransferase